MATALVAVVGLNAGCFQRDAAGVAAGLDRQQAEGVPAPEVVPLRSALVQRSGPLGFLTTPALAGNPFGDLEVRAAAARRAATERSRRRALDALSRLSERRGGPAADYEADRGSALAAATPAELDLLAGRWTAAAEVAELERQTLGESAGGLTADGRPLDLADLVPQLEAASAAAAAAGVDAAAAADARDAVTAS